MKWLTRSIVPSMVALAVLVSFFKTTGPTIVLRATDYAFAPQPLIVHVGDTIAVRNDGKVTHTFICPGCAAPSGNIQPGVARPVHLTTAGTFAYYCVFHRDQGMTGTIVVLAPGQATPAPQASVRNEQAVPSP